ncbi:MAG TPA: DUF2723 domain-containing protein [Anaerolineae bacterium]|nr:DUF2723 domain-containing protein [Anaerolineae bacterium]
MTFPVRLVQIVRRHSPVLGGAFVFSAALAAYLPTLAPTQVPGDPSEYTFIPWILGIAHPPGYAFYTLLAALWQRLIPVGDVAYRTHLLAATAGATSATLVYASVVTILKAQPTNQPSNHFTELARYLAAIFAALSFAFAADVWQHSIHINAHIITLLLATTSLFLLVRWWATSSNRWLYAFALVAGFSPAQHPLLVFAFPAYAVFILLVRPGILREPRALPALIACAAIGLSVFLYYPLRSPATPFGVNNITSWETFIHFVTAEGLRVNLFAFGLADQPARFAVFFNLLQLQYPLFTSLLALVGWITLFRRRPISNLPISILITLFFLPLYVFIMNTIQDVMAYLMLPFMSIAILSGVGTGYVLSSVLDGVFTRRVARGAAAIALVALIGLPLITALLGAPRLSLRDYTAGQEWVQRIYDRFEGQGEGAFLLAPWEALTPLWVEQYTRNHPLDPRDVTLVYVAASSPNPYLDNVFAHFDQGPVYLSDYRREVVAGGLFRLRPDGGSPPLWRVVAPGDPQIPALAPLNLSAEDQLELLGYALDRTALRAGETAYLTLAMRAPATPTHFLMPYALVGERAYRWTTDSRTLSIAWQPGEVIVERYEIALPFATPPGDYPIALGVTDLSAGRDLTLQPTNQLTSQLNTLHVDPPRLAPDLTGQTILADFSAQIALVGAAASGNGQSVQAVSGPWPQPLVVEPGQSIQVWLDWLALQPPLDNYKVFVHLITPGEQLAAPPADFYTPLGGAFPTFLWIPKWIEGQRVRDPYTLNVPPDLPPGDYRIQIGLYGLTSNRRVYILGPDGSLAGDRVILGSVVVR